MSTALSTDEAKRRLGIVRAVLGILCVRSPEWVTSRTLPISLPSTWKREVIGRFVDRSLVQISGYGRGRELRVPPESVTAVQEIIADDRKLSLMLWPSEGVPSSPPLPPSPPPPPTPEEQQELFLANPPPIDELKQPPPGSSPEVIQAWIFTLLHAQTENLIYLRERIDKALAILEQLL